MLPKPSWHSQQTLQDCFGEGGTASQSGVGEKGTGLGDGNAPEGPGHR